MKKLLLLAFSAFLLNACVLEYTEPIFPESNTVQVPNVSGTYEVKDATEKDIYTINLVENTTNTFIINPLNKIEPLKIIIEPLEPEGHYLAQGHYPSKKEVFLGLIKIIENSIHIYQINYNNKEFTELATKFNIYFNEKDEKVKIISFESVDELKTFANLLFAPNFSEELLELKPYK